MPVGITTTMLKQQPLSPEAARAHRETQCKLDLHIWCMQSGTFRSSVCMLCRTCTEVVMQLCGQHCDWACKTRSNGKSLNASGAEAHGGEGLEGLQGEGVALTRHHHECPSRCSKARHGVLLTTWWCAQPTYSTMTHISAIYKPQCTQ